MELQYKKAVRADAANAGTPGGRVQGSVAAHARLPSRAEVLRNLPTFYRHYDKIGRSLKPTERCPICNLERECEACTCLKLFPLEGDLAMEPGPLGQPRCLKSIIAHYSARPKPELDWYGPLRANLGRTWGGTGAVTTRRRHPPTVKRLRPDKKSLRDRLLSLTSKARAAEADSSEAAAAPPAAGYDEEDQ